MDTNVTRPSPLSNRRHNQLLIAAKRCRIQPPERRSFVEWLEPQNQNDSVACRPPNNSTHSGMFHFVLFFRSLISIHCSLTLYCCTMFISPSVICRCCPALTPSPRLDPEWLQDGLPWWQTAAGLDEGQSNWLAIHHIPQQMLLASFTGIAIFARATCDMHERCSWKHHVFPLENVRQRESNWLIYII